MRRYVLTGADGRELNLPEGVSRIGRDPASNKIVLTDPSVSSRHAAIEVTPAAVVLRDLGSTNGTRINHELVHRAVQLHEGDTLTFGDRNLIFRRQAASVDTAPRGIPTPIATPQRRPPEPVMHEGAAIAVATIALLLLTTLLHTVGIADAFQRDDLPLPLPLILAGLVAVPLISLLLLASMPRWGFLTAVLASLLGIAFVVAAGPVFSGDGVRDQLTAEYGSTGFWFIAIASILSLMVEILILTLAVAGWRMSRSTSDRMATRPYEQWKTEA